MTLAVAVLALAGCSDGTGLTAEDLSGTWTASTYQYTDTSNSQNVVDIILRDGATFILTVEEGGTANTVLDDGQGSTSSDTGTFNSTGTTLTLGSDEFTAERNGNVLTLSYSDSSFDFGSGSTSATLRIVMNRS